MKSIEERGQIAGQTYQFCKKEIEADHKIYEKGYIQGATEQEALENAKIESILNFIIQNREFVKPYGWFVEIGLLVEHIKSMYPDKDVVVLEIGSFIMRQKEE